MSVHGLRDHLAQARGRTYNYRIGGMVWTGRETFGLTKFTSIESLRLVVVRSIRRSARERPVLALSVYRPNCRPDGVIEVGAAQCVAMFDLRLSPAHGDHGALATGRYKMEAAAAVATLAEMDQEEVEGSTYPTLPSVFYGYNPTATPDELRVRGFGTQALRESACRKFDTTEPTDEQLGLVWSACHVVDEGLGLNLYPAKYVLGKGKEIPPPVGVYASSDGLAGIEVDIPNPAIHLMKEAGIIDSDDNPETWDGDRHGEHIDMLAAIPKAAVNILRSRMRAILRGMGCFSLRDIDRMFEEPAKPLLASEEPVPYLVCNNVHSLTHLGVGWEVDLWDIPHSRLNKILSAQRREEQSV